MDQASGTLHRRTTWGLAALTCLAVPPYLIATLPGVRSTPGFDPLIDGWLQGGCYVLLALVAVHSLIGDAAHRRLRLALVLALVFRAAGFVLFLAVVRWRQPMAYPSIADAAWLASGVLFVVGVSYVAWRQSPRATRTLVLDAVIGALVVAGIAVSLLFETLVTLAGPGLPRSAVVTNLAYPILDVALLIVIVGLLVAMRGHASAATWSLSAGAVALAAGDALYFHQVVEGTFTPGGPLSALSMLATVALAWSCPWLESVPQPASDGVRGLATPAVLATTGLAVLFLGTVRDVPLPGLILVTTGIVVAIGRALLTREQDSSVAAEDMEEKQLELERFKALVEASTDFVAISDLDGVLIYMNPHGRAMIGLDPDLDVTTTTVADYIEPEAWKKWQKLSRPALTEEGRWHDEQRLRHWGGDEPVVVASASFVIRHPRTGEPWVLATAKRDLAPWLAQQAVVQGLADQRQVLLDHLVEAQEDERARVAADVHDDSVQALAVVELRLHVLRRALEEERPELLGSLDTLHESVRTATDRLRHLLFDLESPARHTDLATALNEAAAYVLEDTVHWSVDSAVDPDLPVADRVVAYRMAKEALVNIRKHADASRVTVRLTHVDGGVEVTVTDDGRGFDTGQPFDEPGHLGLRGIHDRAAIAGGRLEVISSAGSGTTVRIWLPGPVRSPGPADRSH